jgi:alpha-L-rhamnosidase
MLGHAEEWFYRGLAGIVPDASGPGFKRVILRPQVVGDLTWVRARYDSVHGRVESAWRVANGQLAWEVAVPPNVTATVFVPTSEPASAAEGGRPAAEAPGLRRIREERGAAVYEAGSGRYRFEAPLRR